MPDRKLMKDIGFNDPITLTLPAHTWYGFITAYSTTKWQSADADVIAQTIIEELVDPVILKEREAAIQEHKDKHEGLFRLFTGGNLPGGLDPNDPRRESE